MFNAFCGACVGVAAYQYSFCSVLSEKCSSQHIAVQTGRNDDSLVASKETASHQLFSKRQLHVFLLFERETMVCNMESSSNASPEQLFRQDLNILNSIFKVQIVVVITGLSALAWNFEVSLF
jgi:hypothetical protein